MNRAAKLQNSKAILSPVWSRLSDVVIERGQGSFVYTSCGRKLLDFTSGIGVTNTGHCHPKVVKAAQDQVGKLMHVQMGIAYHEPVLQLAEELKTVVPKGLDQFFFSNSGAESVEAALKLARHATGKPNIISFQGSFHGRTIGAMSVTNSKNGYRAGYAPLMAGVHVAPYAHCYRCPTKSMKGPLSGSFSPTNGQISGGHNANGQVNGGGSKLNGTQRAQTCGQSACCNEPLNQIENILATQSAPSETAAILLEPVLGEGGYVMPPRSFMKGVREICDKHGILMILDEVQTGFGRTGKWFGLEHFDIKPDILCFAKALSSGFPLSGIAASPEIQSKWVPGSHGGTMGANAVACAAATATLQVIKEEGLVEKAQVRGEQLRSLLHQLRERYPQIADIRGPGLMVAAEFYTQADDVRPFPNHDPRYAVKKGFTGALTKKCVENGMLLLNTGIHETVRFIPALNVSQEELELGFDIFEQSMKETLKEYYVERDTEARPPQQQVPFFMPLNDEQGGKKMRM